MNCTDVQNQLSAYLDEDLVGDVREAVAGHLGQCQRCKAEFAEFSKMSQAVGRLPQPSVPDAVWTGISVELDSQSRVYVSESQTQRWTKRFPAWATPTRLAIAASILVLTTSSLWFAQHSSDSDQEHGHSAEFVTAMDHYLTTLPSNPESAEQFLLNKYHGQSVDSEGAVKLVGYRPAVMSGLPDGYSLASTSVLKMPCCTCVKAVCKRQDGSTLVLFEHDDETTEWFGQRPSNMAMCGDKECCLVDLDSSIAATWKRGSRSVTAVGVRDVDEVNRLVSWLDNS